MGTLSGPMGSNGSAAATRNTCASRSRKRCPITILSMNNEVSVHSFSETEVQEAPQLVQPRQQRHCALSKTGTTQCYFLVPYSDHFAEVNISVSATRSKYAKHVSYEVLAIYQGCCTMMEEPRVDEQIRRTIQLVYNTHIQAVRLELDTHWYVKVRPGCVADSDKTSCERRPCREGESITCREKKQHLLRSLETPRIGSLLSRIVTTTMCL